MSVDLVMGLDISTKTTGWSVVDPPTKHIIDQGFIDSSEPKDIFDRAEIINNELDVIIQKYTPTKINIEDSLKQFAYGRSRANVILKLARVNGIVSYHLQKDLQYSTEHINASTARKALFGKSRDKAYSNTKKFVLANLHIMLGDDWFNSLPKMKTKDKLSKNAYDICDSIVVAFYK